MFICVVATLAKRGVIEYVCVELMCTFSYRVVSYSQTLLGETERDNPVCLAGDQQEEARSHRPGGNPIGHFLRLPNETCPSSFW